ncbi:hypothetical protein GXM_03172 [Nostoc sphaeroides CCNUC1]|uniref:Uncharacterized protein n=1 Tax=Nostoc sphaeroides CCNUC1 TaxID=2653204 RepID=A0A5P8VZ42_9NOSO|nr:hypothetical protein GXM_03172 [Nostoc sphaeroides CCNUC1]
MGSGEWGVGSGEWGVGEMRETQISEQLSVNSYHRRFS